MIKVDNVNMIIYLTRGDSGTIVFSAKDEEGEDFHPTTGDKIIFAAAKKIGDENLIRIENTMDESEEDFWAIRFEPEHTKSLSFGKYAYDVQIEIRDSSTGELQEVDTIIGKTDTISPTLVVWGEVG